MARYEWTTAKGATVAIEVEKVECVETAYCDGWTHEITKSVKRVVRMTLNGTEVGSPVFDQYQGHACVRFWAQGREGRALLPDNVQEAIWGEERATRAAERALADQREAEYQRGYKRVLDAMKE